MSQLHAMYVYVYNKLKNSASFRYFAWADEALDRGMCTVYSVGYDVGLKFGSCYCYKIIS